MPDNLTIQFQKELEKRGVVASLIEIEATLKERGVDPTATTAPVVPQTNLWENMVTGEAPFKFAPEEYDPSLLKLVGKTVWAGIDIYGLGVPGWTWRKLAGEEAYERTIAPRTTLERWGTGIGGVVGFVGPFGMARRGAAALLRGTTVAKGGKVVGYGATAAGKKFASNTVRILKKDKEFLKWATSKGMSPAEIERWIIESEFVRAGKEAITVVGSRKGVRAFGTHSLRTQYAKKLEENIPKIIEGNIAKIAEAAQPSAAAIARGAQPLVIQDKAIELITREARKYVGGKYNFPITNLHQFLSAKMGNTKLGSLAASSAEEALLFTAVEIPLDFMNSLSNEDVDFNIFKTIQHSVLLGSALGLVRLIPGGSDMGILKSGKRRIGQFLSQRRRFSQYNMSNAGDRMILAKQAQHLWSSQKDVMETLTRKRGVIRSLVKDKKDVLEFAKSEASGIELKKFMTTLEDQFLKQWWPAFAREAGRDLSGSAVRMLAGSMAFNFTTLQAYMAGELPLEDLVFHTVLGAVLSKKGRDIEYRDANGEMVTIPGAHRPLSYDKSFQKVNEYLDFLGMNVDYAAFRNILNNMEIIKNFGTADYANKDIVELVEIGKRNKLFVDVDSELDIKSPDVESNRLYNAYKSVLEGSISETQKQRVKTANELSNKELMDLLINLKDAKFKSLEEYKTSKSTVRGVISPYDIYDIIASASGSSHKEALQIYENALNEAYTIIYEMEYQADGGRDMPPMVIEKDGKLILRPISFDPSSLTYAADRTRGIFGNGLAEDSDSVLGILKRRVSIEGPEIVLTGEMRKRLFGDRESADRGAIDAFDREFTKLVSGDGPLDDNALINVGQSTFNNGIELHQFRESIIYSWRELARLRDEDSAGIFGEDVTTVKRLLSTIYGTKTQYLPKTIIVEDAGRKRLAADSPEQRFARDLLSVLSSDPSYNQERWDIITTKPKRVKQAKVQALMSYFNNSGLMGGFRGGESDVQMWIKRLSDYTFEKALDTATRGDGTPLTDKDYAYLKFLVESRIAGKSFDMVDLSDYVASVKRAFLKSDVLQAADKLSVKTNMARWVRKNFDKVDRVFDESDVAADVDLKSLDFLFSLTSASRKSGTSERMISELIGDFLSLYEDTLAPLWKTEAGGILKPTNVSAVASRQFLTTLLSNFRAIQSGALKESYDGLLDSVYTLYASTRSTEHKKFMVAVHNSLLDRVGNTTGILEVLKKYKLFNASTGEWLLIEDEKTLPDRIKKASADMSILTQPITNERAIEIMVERDKVDFKPKLDSDISTSTTLTKFINDWGMYAPEQYGKKPQEYIVNEVYATNDGNFTLQGFFDYVVGRMISKEIDGITYNSTNWKDMPWSSRKKLVLDAGKVWASIRQTKAVRRMKLGQDDIPLSEPSTIRRNNTSDLIEDMFGEIVFFDPEYRLNNNRVYNIKFVTDKIVANYLADAARVGQKIEARTSAKEVYIGDYVEKQGYLVAFLGDLDAGIGIPIQPYIKGNPLSGQNILAHRFVERLNSALVRFKDDDQLVSVIQGLKSRYVEDDKTRIVERNEVDGQDDQYTFRHLVAGDKKSSQDASLMLSIILGDTTEGSAFWKAVANSKKITKGWSAEKEIAHDVLRRFRLWSNGSTLKLESEMLPDVIKFYGDALREGDAETYIVRDIIDKVLKPISKDGKVKFHLVRDESDNIANPLNPNATSAFYNLSRQIDAEVKAQGLGEKYKIKRLETDDKGSLIYPGKLGDTSNVNSVVIVPAKFMEGLKLITGDYWRTGATAAKPIITSASDLNAVFVGKTMFVVDSDFEPYFKKNDINMLVFTSSSKVIGSDYDSRIIDLKEQNINTLEELIYTDVENKVVRSFDKDTYESNIPIDSIGISFWNSEDKPARIPMHVGSDLVGRDVNNEYFEWLMSDSVVKYQNEASNLVTGRIDRQIATGKLLFGDTGGDLDNQMYSTIARMLEFNMYPNFLPWRKTMKNAAMRHFIQETGMFSPINEIGSQSVAVPSIYAFDHPRGLRNTTFYGDNNDVYTHGQAEVGKNNRLKAIGDNLSVLINNADRPDVLLNWSEFIKSTRKFVKLQPESVRNKKLLDMLEGNVEEFLFRDKRASVLEEVYDFLEEMNSYEWKPGVRAEVALVFHRTPSLKSSDKVIVGLKGFIEDGNFARLNTVDFWTRLEGDHDFDKVNYWWNTPTKILAEWNKNSGNILSIKDDSVHSSVSGLSFDDPKSIVDYNFKSARATRLRGPVVKARRMVQWMRHYQGKDTTVPGYNVVVGRDSDTRISLNQDKFNELDERIAKDAQRIIDSKDGWTEEDFSDEYFKELLFGRDRWGWGGIFEVYRKQPATGEWVLESGKVSDILQDVIYESIKPYRSFLQLATDVYEAGEAKKVDYVTMIEGYQAYRDSIRRLNRMVYKKLELSGKYSPVQLNEVFGGNIKTLRDIFGLYDAFFPASGDRVNINTVGGTEKLLPFDRGIWAVSAVDRLFMEKPRKTNRETEDQFDATWDKYVDKDDMTNKVVSHVVNLIRGEAKSIAFLNTIQSKIKRARSALNRSKRFRNEDLTEMFESRLSRLKDVENKLQERILSDEKTGGAIRDHIIGQVIESLMDGRTVKLPRAGKDGKILPGRYENVNLLKIKSKSKRRSWINNNYGRITYGVWQNRKLVPKIRGMDSNDYAQLVMFHQTMTDMVGFNLDPRDVPYARQFDIDIFDTRRQVSDKWKKFGKGDEYMHNEREDIVMGDLMRLLHEKFKYWEGVHDGLGLMWTLKFMTPEPSALHPTYYNGKFLPGFRDVDWQVKYINLGLNFINSTDLIPEKPMLRMYQRKSSFPYKEMINASDRKAYVLKYISEVFTDKMRVLYGEKAVSDVKPSSTEELLRLGSVQPGKTDFKIFEDSEEHALITERDEIFKAVEQNDLDKIANLSDELKAYYGLTGKDIALDFLSMKGAPPGLDILNDIRQLADYYFMPSKALNKRGNLQEVRSLKDFYGFASTEAHLIFGDVADTNMLVGDKIPHIDVNKFGGTITSGKNSEVEVKQQWIDMTNGIIC